MQLKYEAMIDKIGHWGNYQFIVSLTVILTIFSCPMMIIILPMMQLVPMLKYNNITITDHEAFCRDVYYSDTLSNIFKKIQIDGSSIYNWAYQTQLVCHTKEILAIVGSVFFIGSISANIFLSKFPDIYGRKRVFIFLNLIAVISYLQLTYLVHISQLILAAFITGIASYNMSLSSIIINETLSKNYSGLIMGITNAMFPFAGIINTIMLYYLKDWRYFLISVIITYTFANILGFFYLKETPKWLSANKYHLELSETINFILKFNKINENFDNNNLTSNDYNEESVEIFQNRNYIYSYWDLLKYSSIRSFTLKFLYLWIISGFCFFGLLLNLAANLSSKEDKRIQTDNIYASALVTYSAEILGEILSGDLSLRIGRKNTALLSFSLASVGSIVFIFIGLVSYSLQLIFLFISAVGIAAGFNVLYIYTPELFPTNVKSLSMSLFSIFNRLVGASIPLILTYTSHITFIIFAMSLGAVLVILSLPESLGYTSGDEIDEIKGKIYELRNIKEEQSLFLPSRVTPKSGDEVLHENSL